MAHYLQIHRLPRTLVMGAKVLQSTENPLVPKMVELLSIPRFELNDVFRKHYDVNSEWDQCYFALSNSDIYFILQELDKQTFEDDYYDKSDFNVVRSFLDTINGICDGDLAFFISWSK